MNAGNSKLYLNAFKIKKIVPNMQSKSRGLGLVFYNETKCHVILLEQMSA